MMKRDFISSEEFYSALQASSIITICLISCFKLKFLIQYQSYSPMQSHVIKSTQVGLFRFAVYDIANPRQEIFHVRIDTISTRPRAADSPAYNSF